MSESPAAPASGERSEAQMRLERIYLKDASFESPASPAIFGQQFRQDLQVDINTKVNGLGDARHEVVLSVTVTSKKEAGDVIFVAEVQQAGVFVVQGASGQVLQKVLGVACTNALFPYLREALDALVIKGGFSPLRLAPINFEGLFNEALRQSQNQSKTTH